jgi:PAS domain S-box-containing protein
MTFSDFRSATSSKQPSRTPGPAQALEAANFQSLFEALPGLYVILDTELRILAVSDAHLAATNSVRQEILGRDLFAVFPDNPDDPDATGSGNLRQSLERVLLSKRPDAMPALKYDIARPAAEGGGFEERYWSVVNTPILDAASDIKWIVNTVDDVTDFIRQQTAGIVSEKTIADLRSANTALAASNVENAALHGDLVRKTEQLETASSFLNLVIENIPAMIVVKDARTHQFVLINRAGEELTGFDRAQTIGKSDYDLFPPEQAKWFVAGDDAVRAGGKLQVIEDEPISTRENGIRNLRTRKMPVPDESGETKYLLVMSEDVTEEKKSQLALKASEAMFRTLLSASPDAVMVIDPRGLVLIASERVEQMYGYKPEELVGTPIIALTPERMRTAAVERLGQIGEPNVPRLEPAEELRALRRDGTEFPVEISFNTHRTPTGDVVIVAVRDVTDRKAVETQLLQAQKMEAIGNLTGGLAHDFNNLLSVVIGNLDLLREEIGDQPQIDQFAEQALSAAVSGAELTRRLLAFARRQPLQPQQVAINDLVENISELLRRTLGDNVQIVHRLGEAWPIVADPAQLESCLVNMIANARDAMPEGGTVTIATANRHLDADYANTQTGVVPGDYALIEITDTGSGMSPETMSQIFEPFFTTKQEGRGTGLGLSMVFGFIKQSGGHISVYSEIGAGTTFRLYFPRSSALSATSPVFSSPPLQLGQQETILVVEDNPGLLQLVVKQLSQLGYRCVTAVDAPAALRVLEDQGVDLVFSDVMMPGGMSGHQLAQIVEKRWPAAKVLLTSGFPEEKVKSSATFSWNGPLLTKPYRKDELAKAVRDTLDRTTDDNAWPLILQTEVRSG